jgi:hypothetical protein
MEETIVISIQCYTKFIIYADIVSSATRKKEWVFPGNKTHSFKSKNANFYYHHSKLVINTTQIEQ